MFFCLTFVCKSGFTVLCPSAHCLRLNDKLSILTDELCSCIKDQTVSKRQVLGNAVFVNDLLMAVTECVSLSLRADAEREETLNRARARGPGQYWTHLTNE